MVTLPVVAVAALGGTIAMRRPQPGEPVTPKLSADDLLAAVPAIKSHAQIVATTVTRAPSPSITINDLLRALQWANEQVAQGATGVVFTHGTDTLEESAFLLDLLWDHPEPLVLTGAMRSSDLLGADGEANLYDAVICAASEHSRSYGVLVCLNQTIHLASSVVKNDSHALEAFQSPGRGPAGYVREGAIEMLWPAPPRSSRFARPSSESCSIPIVEASVGEDGAFLHTVDATRIDALVVAGSGVGHVSAPLADCLERFVDEGLVVVVASRTERSGTARALYGYVGSESDLVRRGIILTGQLSARKARLALFLMIEAGYSREAIRTYFQHQWRGN
ncbi:MAG: asparaginase [Actinomycetaceae bacterium]|nr:asparaginase [Actinomycetaceae bacterium]